MGDESSRPPHFLNSGAEGCIHIVTVANVFYGQLMPD